MTWGRKYGDQSNCSTYPPVCTYLGMQERLRDSYLTMGFDNEATVAPVGISFKNSIFQDSTIDLYSPDNSHPSIYGSYLAACTFYSTIFKKSSVSCSYRPNAISSSDALFLQQIASSTVLDSISVWNIFQSNFEFSVNGNSVNFTNSSSNFENCFWDFGDGTYSVDTDPLHTYQQTGTYNVSLLCQTNYGCISDTINKQINIVSTNIAEIESEKKAFTSFNLLGKEVKGIKNGFLIQKDNSGKVSKKIIIE